MFSSRQKQGFTLVEILVVVALISLISSIVFASVRTSRVKARDIQRISALKQIQNALEMYHADNRQYPPVNYARTDSAADNCGDQDRWCTLEDYLEPYLKPLPRDPLGLQNSYRLYYDSDSGDGYQTYGIMARMESPDNYYLTKDGGYYPISGIATDGQYYELGQQPGYCMAAGYSGGNRSWWSGDTIVTVCRGGN